MVIRAFPFLTYNLSTNFFHCSSERKLIHIIIESLIAYSFTSNEIKDKVIKFPIQSDSDLVTDYIPEKWIEIEDNVYKSVVENVPVSFLEVAQNTVPFIGSQIYSLFRKITFNDRILFLNNIVLNISGTVNTLGTVLRILRESENANTWKFLFACKYFAGEEVIINYFQKLPLSVKEWCVNFEHSNCNDGCYWLCFNLWHLGKKNEIFRRYRSIDWDGSSKGWRNSDQEYDRQFVKLAFENALKNGNENGVHFIFEKYISNSVDENNILDNVFRRKYEFNSDMTNIVVYLVSQIEAAEFPTWFTDHILYIFEKLFQDLRFHSAYLRMFNYLQGKFAEINKLTSFIHSMILIMDSKIKSGFKRETVMEYRKTFMNAIDNFSIESRNHIFDLERANYDLLLKFVFDKMEGEIIVKLLTEIITDTGKRTKDVLKYKNKTDTQDTFWIVPLARYDTNFIEKILSAFLNNETGEQMRKWFFAIYHPSLFVYFMVTYRFDNINSFLEWTYSSSDQEDYVRRIIRKDNLLSIIKTIIFEEEGLFDHENVFFYSKVCKVIITPVEDKIKYIDVIINWCLENPEGLQDPDGVRKYKTYLRAYLKTSFYDYIAKWVTDLKYDQLDNLFSWLSASGRELQQIKMKLCNDNLILETFSSKGLQDEYLKFLDKYYTDNNNRFLRSLRQSLRR
ncbi:UNVERIFIED_CONTAM: hypothetical protein RMT77_018621 [Armadillidium vulgare]